MRVLLLSGSRADRAGLEALYNHLRGITEFETACASCEPSLARDDMPNSVVHQCAEAMRMVSHAYLTWTPDVVFLLGDRYEILCAAQAAVLHGIPIAHLSGGDETLGSQDNVFRHAISQMATLHFPTHEMAADHLRRMDIEPSKIFVVGYPAIDAIKQAELASREYTLAYLKLERPDYVLVGFQPATLADAQRECGELLLALSMWRGGCVFTGLNKDIGAREIERKIREFCDLDPWRRRYIEDMPQPMYLSVLQHSVMMVGNSSSGFYEAPSLKKAFVNIGERQKGRIAAGSVISCEARAGAIEDAMRRAMELDCSSVVNPYGDGHACEQIANVLRRFKEYY